MINLRDLLEPADFVHRLSGVRIENIYNTMLKYNLTVSVAAMLPLMHLLIRQRHAALVRALARYWQQPSDLVVSLIPHFNRAIFEGLRLADLSRSRPSTPMITVMTDLADYPPHFWMESQPQDIVCGTAKAHQQALMMGYPEQHIFRTSGMVVNPEFYARPETPREQDRVLLGLRPDLPTGIVLFGGFGSRRMLTIAQRIAEARIQAQLLFVCGHNDELRKRLLEMRLPFPHCVVGFSREIPRLMKLADFFVGKPGPGSISEALVSGLPLIVERSASTMVHERYNTDWIVEHRVGLVLHSFADIAKAVELIVDREALERLRSNVRAVENRAVFEMPDIFQAVMDRRASGERENPNDAQHRWQVPAGAE
ncbi:MAG TPA: glycosyltransferase [Candidatus Binataceae bacterium]|nr:glycosyltransferase [Candidatus Binataceae bacterium]